MAACKVNSFYFWVSRGSNVFSTTLFFYYALLIFAFIFSSSYLLSFKKSSINLAYFSEAVLSSLFFFFYWINFSITSSKTFFYFFSFISILAIDFFYFSRISHLSLSLLTISSSEFYSFYPSPSSSSYLSMRCLLSVYVHIKFIKLLFSAKLLMGDPQREHFFYFNL